jgi:hypothetical protein
MKRLLLTLVASAVPMHPAAQLSPVAIGDPPVTETTGQVYFVQGKVTTPFGTFKVDLKVTTCKQGTSGCKPS